MKLGAPTAHQLWRAFDSAALRCGSARLLDESTALALIREAERARVAVVAVDQIKPEAWDGYAPLRARPLTPMERLASWRQAREFVEGLAGRDLHFEVLLESPWRTWWAQFWSGNTGVGW